MLLSALVHQWTAHFASITSVFTIFLIALVSSSCVLTAWILKDERNKFVTFRSQVLTLNFYRLAWLALCPSSRWLINLISFSWWQGLLIDWSSLSFYRRSVHLCWNLSGGTQLWTKVEADRFVSEHLRGFQQGKWWLEIVRHFALMRLSQDKAFLWLNKL